MKVQVKLLFVALSFFSGAGYAGMSDYGTYLSNVQINNLTYGYINQEIKKLSFSVLVLNEGVKYLLLIEYVRLMYMVTIRRGLIICWKQQGIIMLLVKM